MSVITKNQLLEAGSHFGHNTRRWNPKMKEYIFGERNGIYIIDLDKTVRLLNEAYQSLLTLVQNGGKVLFVGTRKQTQEVVKEEATRAEAFYVDQRWLGGTLTNHKTIRKSIARLFEIERMEEEGVFDVLPKKEVILLRKEKEKLDKFFTGIRDMTALPDAMVVVDPKSEQNAVAEARKLKIPIYGIVDTNCDPDEVDFVIPANDDAIRSVKLLIGTLANAVVEGNGGTPITIEFTDDSNDDRNNRRGGRFNRRDNYNDRPRRTGPRTPVYGVRPAHTGDANTTKPVGVKTEAPKTGEVKVETVKVEKIEKTEVTKDVEATKEWLVQH